MIRYSKLKLFDTLSRSYKFPNLNKTVSIYLCGPTLYGKLHLGNLRPIIVFDFLIRYLKYSQILYKYVQNLTDVDEKIIKKSCISSIPISKLVNEYSNSFMYILNSLKVIIPDYLPTVSENISDLHLIIQSLLLHNKAFWDRKTQAISFYNNPKLRELYSHSFRTQESKASEDNSNFVLWKENNFSTFGFTSPWFYGIPGWHIECFAIIQKYLEPPITIHGGGVDLKFPHHENENLLSRALFGFDLSEIWVHVGQVLNEDGKLSKSSNYDWEIEECAKKYSWDFIRYIFLKTQYSKPFLVTSEIMDNMWKEWNRYINVIHWAQLILSTDQAVRKFEEVEILELDPLFIAKLEEDLNLPEVLSWLERLRKELQFSLKILDYQKISYLVSNLSFHLRWMGFTIPNLSDEDFRMVKMWSNLVELKRYNESDKIRSKLQEKGLYFN